MVLTCSRFAFTSSISLRAPINISANVACRSPPLMVATLSPKPQRPHRLIIASILSAAAAVTIQLNHNLPQAYGHQILATQEPHTASTLVLSDGSPSATLGEKIGARLQKLGWSDEWVVFAVSALPLIESRGGVPLACLLRMNPIKTVGLVLAGNLAPIFGLLGVMRLRWVQRISRFFLERAMNKIRKMGSEGSRLMGLALFVGVPLPGTGAWTGALMAFVMELPFWKAIATLAAGVLMSEAILLTLCAMGVAGAVVAGVLLLGFGIASIVRSERARRAAENAGEAEPLNPGRGDPAV